MRLRRVAAALLCAFGSGAINGAATDAVAPAAAPQRIVSMNLCADELVLRLATPGTVRSVTWLARDRAISTVAPQAREVPVNRGLAEEIVALQPDLVVAGIYTTRTTVALLKRLKVPVLELDVPSTLPDAMRQIRSVAEALGRGSQGAALVAEMEAAVASIQAEHGPSALGSEAASDAARVRPVAAVYNANGFTVGPGSLVHDLMTRAGLRNLAAEQRISYYGRLPLELLLVAQPDLLIMNSIAERPPALAYEVMRHPALRQQFKPAQTVIMPPALWTCAGPQIVDALALLTRAARAAQAAGATQPGSAAPAAQLPESKTIAEPARLAPRVNSSALSEAMAPGRSSTLAPDRATR